MSLPHAPPPPRTSCLTWTGYLPPVSLGFLICTVASLLSICHKCICSPGFFSLTGLSLLSEYWKLRRRLGGGSPDYRPPDPQAAFDVARPLTQLMLGGGCPGLGDQTSACDAVLLGLV